MERLGGAGGGGAIYEDGEPVTVALDNDETVSPPTGETWVVTVQMANSNTEKRNYEVNGVFLDIEPGLTEFDLVMTDDDKIRAVGELTATISGWSV